MRNALSNWLDRVVLGESPTRRLWFARRMPDGYIRNTQRLDFRTTVRWVAARSAFYRRKFKEHRIDPAMVKCPGDLGDIFTTSTDLLTHPVEEFLCDRPQLGFETTGTLSPKSKKVFFSLEEMRDMGRDGAAGLYALGVRREEIGRPRQRIGRGLVAREEDADRLVAQLRRGHRLTVFVACLEQRVE